MSNIIEIQLIAIFVSIACGLIGSFLVLKKMSMMTDSITHTILLGIVIAYFVVKDLNSPWLIIGASLTGLFTVFVTQKLSQKDTVSEESAIGLVFPFLFSIAVILISKYSKNAHIDIDSVLLGEIAFAPFNRLVLFGVDVGAKALYSSGLILLLNLLYIKAFFKEIKLSIFDPILAVLVGISPVLINYSLMAMVSVTTVVAFESVGSILVVAFMIGPAITAYMVTEDLKLMLLLSCVFSVCSAVLGLQLALIFDVSIAGCMAVMVGIVFLVTFLVVKLARIN